MADFNKGICIQISRLSFNSVGMINKEGHVKSQNKLRYEMYNLDKCQILQKHLMVIRLHTRREGLEVTRFIYNMSIAKNYLNCFLSFKIIGNSFVITNEKNLFLLFSSAC